MYVVRAQTPSSAASFLIWLLRLFELFTVEASLSLDVATADLNSPPTDCAWLKRKS